MSTSGTTPQPSRPTARTVAEAAGVSVALVSFALNGRPGVAPETRARILAAADDLGYRPDARAQALRTGKTGVVGLVVRNVANPFFSRLLSGMQEGAEADGVSVLAMDSQYDPDRERELVRTLAAQRPEGLAVVPVGGGGALQQWRQLMPGTPLVTINTLVAHTPNVVNVAPDNVRAVRLAFDHLYGLGHRRIAVLSAPLGLMPDGDRLVEYRHCCRTAGVPEFPIFADLRGEELLPALVAALRAPERPTAIITNSDYTATFVYAAAQELGLRVGHDISVVGHDDTVTSAFMGPSLTTVRVNVEELGRAAYRRLAKPGLGDHQEPVELIIRGSTGRPANRR